MFLSTLQQASFLIHFFHSRNWSCVFAVKLTLNWAPWVSLRVVCSRLPNPRWREIKMTMKIHRANHKIENKIFWHLFVYHNFIFSSTIKNRYLQNKLKYFSIWQWLQVHFAIHSLIPSFFVLIFLRKGGSFVIPEELLLEISHSIMLV